MWDPSSQNNLMADLGANAAADVSCSKMRTHQNGWVAPEGKHRQKWVGRFRVYKPDGKLSFPKKFLGYKSEMSKSQAALKLQKFLRAGGDKPVSSLNFSDYWTDTYVPRHRVAWSTPSAKGYAAYFNAYLQPEFGAVRMTDIDDLVAGGMAIRRSPVFVVSA